MADFLEALKSFVPSFGSSAPTGPTAAADANGALDPRSQSFDDSLAGPVAIPAAAPAAPAPAAPVLSQADQLTRDLNQIRAANSSREAMDLFTLSNDRGNGLTANNKLVKDYKELTPYQFQLRHGTDAYNEMVAADIGGNRIHELAATERNGSQHVSDAATSILSGGVSGGQAVGDLAIRASGIGPLSRMAIGGYNDLVDAGSKINEAVTGKPGALDDYHFNAKLDAADVMLGLNAKVAKATTDFIDKHLHTEEWNRLHYVTGVRSQLDNIDDEAKYEADKAANGKLVAGFRNLGRGIVTGTKELIEDPYSLEEGVFNGVGSLLDTGPTAGIMRGLAKAADRVIAPGVTRLSAAAVDKALEKATTTAAIVALEGGGNDIQAIQDVQDMSQEELDQQPAYQKLLASGMDKDQARTRMAVDSGGTALAITAPIAALTAGIVSKFEAHPFGRVTAKDMFGNMGREFGEETVQSGAGQFGSNVGKILTGVNPDQDPSEGVGVQGIQGGIFGAGGPVVTEGPGIALHAAGQAALGPVKAAASVAAAPLKAAYDAVKAKGEAILAKNAAESSVSEENMAPAAATAAEQAQNVAEGLRSAATEAGAQGPEVDSYINNVAQAAHIQPEELAQLPASVTEKLPATANRFDVLAQTAKTAADETAPEADRIAAGNFLLKQSEDAKKLFTEDQPEAMDAIPQDRPEMRNFLKYAKVLQSITRVPAISQALDWARNQMQMSDRDLSQVDLNSPEGQKIIDLTVNTAATAPQAVNENVANQILKQADEGTLQLPAERRRILRNVTSTLNSDRLFAANNRAMEPMALDEQANELKQELDATKAKDERLHLVGRQIAEDGGTPQQPSLMHQVAGINQAENQGDMETVRRKVQHLVDFTQSHINKVEAINQSIANGDGQNVEYQALSPNGSFYTNRKGVGVKVGNPGQERFGRTVHAEATSMAELANHFIRQHPEFGHREKVVPPLALDQATQTEKRGSPKTAESTTASGATTPQTSENSAKSELPPPPPQPARESEQQTPSADEKTVSDATGKTENPSSEQVLKVEPVASETRAKEPAAPVSRVTPEQAKSLSDEELQNHLDQLVELRTAKKASAEDDATFKVLNDEMNQREDAANAAMNEDQAANAEGTPKQQLQDLLRNDSYREQSNDLAAKLSDEELLDAYETSTGMRFTDIPGKAKDAVDAAIAKISAATGIADLGKIARMIKSVDMSTTTLPKSAAIAFTAGNIIAFSTKFIEAINNGKLKQASVDYLLAHEIGHQLDFFARDPKKGYAYYTSTDNSFALDGKLYAEFKGLKDQVSNKVFDYIEGHSNPEVQANEFFAELAAFVINEPELAAKLIPDGVKAYEQVLAKAGDNRGIATTRSGTRDAADGPVSGNQEVKPRLSDQEVTDLLAQSEEGHDDVTMEEAFPNLAQVDGRNWFQKAFRFPKTQISRMLNLQNPLQDVIDMLAKPYSLVSFMGKDVDYKVTAQDRRNLSQMLTFARDQVLGVMNERMRTKVMADGLLAKLQAGEQWVLRTRNLRALNLMEVNEKGEPVYNPALGETAVIAGIDWALNATDRATKMTAEDVAELLGIDVGEVKSDYVTALNRGLSLDVAKRSLAENIRKFWGVRADKAARDGLAKGIPEAIAAEVLLGMHQAGLIELGVENFPGVTNKTPGRVWFDTRPDNVRRAVQELNGLSEFFSDLALNDREPEGWSINKPVEEPDHSQWRNPVVPLSGQAKKALKNAQQAAYHLVELSHDFFEALGEENFVSIMSGRDYKKGDLDNDHNQMGLNKGHWESVKGLQRSLSNSFNNVAKQVEAMRKHGKDAVVYYKHHLSKLGRPQMAGLNNPQTDKHARHVFMPTKSTLNLADQSGKDWSRFLVAVAQGLGKKTEKQFRAVSMQQVIDEAMTPGGTYEPLVQDMKAWLVNYGNGKKSVLPASIVEKLKAATLSEHGIFSLIDVARYQLAQEKGQDLSAFTTHNYLEADGKTNGPLNSLMLWATGPITENWLRMVGKGGVYFGRLGKTLASHMEEDNKDLYEHSSDGAQDKVVKLGQRLEKSPEAHALFMSFHKLMSALNADLKMTTNADGSITLEIKRGLTKNPLTITVYGSGIKGIAGNVADELAAAIYEKMSESLQGGGKVGDLVYGEGNADAFLADLEKLTSRTVAWDRDLKRYVVDDHGIPLEGSRSTFELSPAQYSNLRANVRTFLVNPMRQAIDESVTNHVEKTTKTIQQATQLQGIVVKAIFQREIAARLALEQSDPEKYDYHPGEWISEEERQKVLDRLLKYAPIIDTGTQGYFLSGGETGALFGRNEEDGKPLSVTLRGPNGQQVKVSQLQDFSRSLTNNLSIPAYTYGPTKTPGVSSAPTLTIGSGDGQMMLNFLSQNPDAARRILHVFDGLNMPLDSIEDYSQKINEAVFNTWTSNDNPVRAVADSFAAFMRSDLLKQLFPSGEHNSFQEEALLEASRVFHNTDEPKSRSVLIPSEVRTFMEQVLDELKTVADDTDIRRQLYREFALSVDQMASAESPYSNEGTIALPENADLSTIAEAMTNRYNELNAELRAKRAGEQIIEQGSEAVAKAIAEVGASDENGVRVVKASELGSLFQSIGSLLTPTQKELMNNAVRLLQDSGYRIVFGDAAELRDWEAVNNADRVQGQPGNYYGKVDPVAKLIMIPNQSGETIVHELVHAATFDKVKAYYENPSLLSPVERDAVARIEGLMGEWLTLNFANDSKTDYGATLLAENAIAEHQLAGRNAEALNEFMAWVLANQHLADLAKKTKVKNPLFRVVGKVLEQLKFLIWGTQKATKVGDDLLSNLPFNTEILMAEPSQLELLKQDFAQVALYQSAAFGNDERLSAIRQRLNSRVITWMNEGGRKNPATHQQRMDRTNAVKDNRQAAKDILGVFAYHFHDLGTMQAKSTFAAVQAAFMTEIALNPNSLTRIEEIYTHVIRTLTPADLRENNDPNDQQDMAWAQDKYSAIEGQFISRTDKLGRSSLMPSFLALAMTSDSFRKVLSGIEVPKSEKNTGKTLDAVLENIGNASMDRLSQTTAGEGKAANVQDALDNLMESMIENVSDQRAFIAQRTESGLEKFETYLADAVQAFSAKVVNKTRDIRQNSQSRVVKLGAGLAFLAATAINEDDAEKASKGVLSWLNRKEGLQATRALFNDLNGHNEDNDPVVGLVSKVRAEAQKTRQEFREELPKKLASAFKRVINKAEWTAMFHALAKTDLAVLTGRLGVNGSLEMLTSSNRLGSEIQTLARLIEAAEPQRFAKIQEKAKQLAHYMLTGEHGVNLLSNAEAVARLLSEPGMKAIANAPSQQTIDEIDQLTTLYAIEGLSQEVKDTVGNLIRNEQHGMEFVTSYLIGQRVDEMSKAKGNSVALFNHYKGWIPSEAMQGGSLIIASDSEHGRLMSRGYTQLGAYNGSTADRSLDPMSYYFAPVSGTAPFSQGVMQTVHQTASGIDPQTGYTMGEVMAGRITDPKIVKIIERRMATQAQTNENLKPVFDDAGNVVAYERMADPAKLTGLNRSTDLSKMIGVWRGRQVEEHLAQKSNENLVDRMYDKWQSDLKERRGDEYVNLFKLPANADPVLVEAAKLIPRQARDYARKKFGPDRFMVRRDMALDAFGERQASVGDFFGGTHRWHPKIASEFEKVATGLFGMVGKGNDAYRILVSAEKNIQSVVANAKALIVVKSVVVPAANMVSNMFQLVNRGVPLKLVLRGMGRKASEVNFYIKSRKRQIDLEADLRAAKGKNDLVAIRKIENQLQSIHDDHRRLSIWPLIEEGEFSAISNGQVTQEDLALADGKWQSYVEQKVNSLPDGLRTPARYAMVTRDTALFQGLARAVQYGDFIAKAILYDDLVGRKKVASHVAVRTVSDAFVNYNRLAGRTRQYLESVGLSWFYHYKLRITKEAVYLLRHNPLRCLLMSAVPALPIIGDIGAPVSDNFLSLFHDGKLGFSIGPSMGLHSFRLNPWVNLFH